MKATIIFSIIGICLFFMFIYMHEVTHQEVYKHYGINSTIYMNVFENAHTTSNVDCPNEGCELSQDMVDVVGYHLECMFFLIFAGFLVIIAILESKL